MTPLRASSDDSVSDRRGVAPEKASEPRWWSVRVYGFDGSPFDPIVHRPAASSARYAAFKAIREAGYFNSRDGFRRFLSEVRVRPATDSEIRCAPRIEPPHTPHPEA